MVSENASCASSARVYKSVSTSRVELALVNIGVQLFILVAESSAASLSDSFHESERAEAGDRFANAAKSN